jgi:hypothetical protein
MRPAALNNKSAEPTKFHITEHAIRSPSLRKNKRTVCTILVFFLLGGWVERQRRNNPRSKKVVAAGPTRRGPSDAQDERERVCGMGTCLDLFPTTKTTTRVLGIRTLILQLALNTKTKNFSKIENLF